ncbi:MAG: hypothetical protein JWO86_3454 [Myxococcaceae bacterium]|jgi:hypothetical protein|nr:hypothetical protein [Myxococcaceae bacterium]MEA2752002.1 hypothetical protein [Myxococcales bacterium]
MKKWAIVAGCAAVAAVALWLTVFRPSEEDRIRKVLDRFAKAVAVKQDDNIISRAGRVNSELKETVADDVYVDVADFNVRVTNRKDLAENATKAGLMFTSADCELTSMIIKVDESATTAKVDALALVTGSRNGERKVDKRPVHFLLRKDGSWKITTIDVATARQD